MAAPLEIDEESGDVLNIGKERREELMPLGTGTSKKAFRNWWKRRSVPETRKGLTDALRVLHISTASGLMVRNLALSLTDSLKFVGVVPIFDSGNAMFWDRPRLEDVDLTDISVSSFRKKESLLLRYVKDRKIFDLSKIPEPEFLEELYRKDETISEKRLAQMIDLYQKKAEMLEEFQR